MGAIKAKPVRLIDLLGTLNEQEIVVVRLNSGRNSFSNTVGNLEKELRSELNKNINGITCMSGTINIFI